jgi:hypothetical protein
LECRSTGKGWQIENNPETLIEEEAARRKNLIFAGDLILGAIIVIVLNVIALLIYRWFHNKKRQ